MKRMKHISIGMIGLFGAAAVFAAEPHDAAAETLVMEELVVVGQPLSFPESTPVAEVTYAPKIEIDLNALTDKIEFTPTIRLEF